jgi:hypothetical protein
VQVRSLLPTHLARAQHLEHDECRSVFASGVFFRLKRARGTSHYVKRKRRRSGKHTKVVAVRMPAKEMRFAAQVHEGDDRAERRGLGARMDASDAQVCRRFLNLQAPPTLELASTSSSLNATTAPTLPCAFCDAPSRSGRGRHLRVLKTSVASRTYGTHRDPPYTYPTLPPTTP